MHWLQFRGPNSSGIAPENADPPVHFSADTNLLWKTEMLPGWSSPCIVNERIFLTGFDDTDSLLYTIGIDRENGEILWKDSVFPKRFYDIHPLNSFANPTVASNGDIIISAFPNYGVIAYDLDGHTLWELPHEPLRKFYGGAASPVIKDSVVIVVINSIKDPRVVGINCQSGDPVWIIRAADHPWSSFTCRATPVLWNNLLIMHLSHYIVAYDLSDRNMAWWFYTSTLGDGSPVVKDNVLYLNTFVQLGEEKNRGGMMSFGELLDKCDKNANGQIEQDEFDDDMTLYKRTEDQDHLHSTLYYKEDRFFGFADKNKNWAIEEEEWNSFWELMASLTMDHGMLALPVEGSGERPFEDLRWKVVEDSPEVPSALVVNEHVLFIKNGGIMTVINRESGDVIHKERVGAAGSYLSSPMLAGEHIYTCSFNGTVTVLSADDFSVLAHNKLKEKIGASPVAVDDVLYVRTDKHLYAFRDQ